MKKYKIIAVGKNITSPSENKKYIFTTGVKVGDVIEVKERNFRKYDPSTDLMIDENGRKQDKYNTFCYAEVEEVVDEIDLSKFKGVGKAKYKVLSLSIKGGVPSKNKLYCTYDILPRIGEIIEIPEMYIRGFDGNDSMVNIEGKHKGTWGVAHYAEIEPEEKKEEKAMTIRDHYSAMQNECGIKVGDRVRILRKAKNYEMGWGTVWDDYCMDKLVGKEHVVKSINPSNGFRLDSYYLPFFVLEKIQKPDTKLTMAGNNVVITNESMKFGCTILTAAQVEELIVAWNKHKAS